MIPPHPHRQAPTVHGINSRIVFLTLSDVLCVRCQYIGIHSRNVLLNRSGLILQKKIRKFAENKQTDRQTNKQTDREFKYRDRSYPLWIVGESGSIQYRYFTARWTNNRALVMVRSGLGNKLREYNVYLSRCRNSWMFRMRKRRTKIHS